MKPTPMDAYTVIILIAIGIAAGMLSGLVGVGGGIALVPLLVYFLHYNQHQAQGTSLGVLSFPVVILAFITYYNDCKKTGAPIEFNVIAIIGIGFVAGGLLGSKIAVKIDQARSPLKSTKNCSESCLPSCCFIRASKCSTGTPSSSNG